MLENNAYYELRFMNMFIVFGAPEASALTMHILNKAQMCDLFTLGILNIRRAGNISI